MRSGPRSSARGAPRSRGSDRVTWTDLRMPPARRGASRQRCPSALTRPFVRGEPLAQRLLGLLLVHHRPSSRRLPARRGSARSRTDVGAAGARQPAPSKARLGAAQRRRPGPRRRRPGRWRTRTRSPARKAGQLLGDPLVRRRRPVIACSGRGARPRARARRPGGVSPRRGASALISRASGCSRSSRAMRRL